jgi:hypothetical protein
MLFLLTAYADWEALNLFGAGETATSEPDGHGGTQEDGLPCIGDIQAAAAESWEEEGPSDARGLLAGGACKACTRLLAGFSCSMEGVNPGAVVLGADGAHRDVFDGDENMSSSMTLLMRKYDRPFNCRSLSQSLSMHVTNTRPL